MIIKATRGNDFDGLFAYVLRHGQHRHLGDARIITMEGVYDERTAAAQMAFNAALAPSRTRPVVHLMGRAEKPLTDPQYMELAERMMRVTRLEGRAFVAVVHDDGHLHVVACEMDEEGHPPARWLWHEAEKREVEEQEALRMPRGVVKRRAWDSHLAWRLTELARDLEAEWGLTRLSSAPQQRDDTPKIDRWQQERLERSAEVPLQDRYREQVRAALALSSWDDRVAALAQHGLAIRVHRAGERVRGLQVHSLSNAADFVKISAFDMGGMPKLDASADQPFLEWESARRAAKVNLRKINLRKPEATFDPEMARLRASFRDELKAWHVSRGRRTKAFKQYRRDKALIQADLASFDQTMSNYLSPAGMRAARREKRGGMQVIAKARLDYELALAGPDRPRPVFIDFVKGRAGSGDAGAARVYRDIVGGITETRRRDHDRKVAELSAAVRDLRARADAVAATMKRSGEQLRLIMRDIAARADQQRARITLATMAAVQAARKRAEGLAIRLAERLDAAAHRIRVDRKGRVRVDRWFGSAEERWLVGHQAHQFIFRRWAQAQSRDIATLSREVLARSAVRSVDGQLAADTARLPADVLPLVRWAAEPEIVAALSSADRAKQAEMNRRARQDAAHRESVARAAAERSHIERLASMAAALRAVSPAPEVRASGIRQGEKVGEQGPARRVEVAAGQPTAERVKSAARADHDRLLAAAAPRMSDGAATRTYLNLWAAVLCKRPPEQPISPHDLHAIDLAATKATIEGGFSADAVRRVIAARSPIGSDAAKIFNEALSDPAIRQVHDDHVEAQDRRDTELWMRERQPLNEAGERFIDLWIEILNERPLDPSILPTERNRAIDYEVATAMLAKDLNLQDVQQLVAGLSPAIRLVRPRDRANYVDTLMETVAERLPPDDPRRARVPLSRLIERSLSVDDDDVHRRIAPVGAIANAPPGLEEVASERQAGQVVIDGWPLIVAERRVGDNADGEQTNSPGAGQSSQADLFDAAGRPLDRVRGLLQRIHRNRSQFDYKEGRLSGIGLNPDEQQELDRLLDDQRVRTLVNAAWHNASSASATRDPKQGRDR
nr:hypothetical protein [uncultured Sphingomonas sp.]